MKGVRIMTPWIKGIGLYGLLLMGAMASSPREDRPGEEHPQGVVQTTAQGVAQTADQMGLGDDRTVVGSTVATASSETAVAPGPHDERSGSSGDEVVEDEGEVKDGPSPHLGQVMDSSSGVIHIPGPDISPLLPRPVAGPPVHLIHTPGTRIRFQNEAGQPVQEIELKNEGKFLVQGLTNEGENQTSPLYPVFMPPASGGGFTIMIGGPLAGSAGIHIQATPPDADPLAWGAMFWDRADPAPQTNSGASDPEIKQSHPVAPPPQDAEIKEVAASAVSSPFPWPLPATALEEAMKHLPALGTLEGFQASFPHVKDAVFMFRTWQAFATLDKALEDHHALWNTWTKDQIWAMNKAWAKDHPLAWIDMWPHQTMNQAILATLYYPTPLDFGCTPDSYSWRWRLFAYASHYGHPQAWVTVDSESDYWEYVDEVLFHSAEYTDIKHHLRQNINFLGRMMREQPLPPDDSLSSRKDPWYTMSRVALRLSVSSTFNLVWDEDEENIIANYEGIYRARFKSYKKRAIQINDPRALCFYLQWNRDRHQKTFGDMDKPFPFAYAMSLYQWACDARDRATRKAQDAASQVRTTHEEMTLLLHGTASTPSVVQKMQAFAPHPLTIDEEIDLLLSHGGRFNPFVLDEVGHRLKATITGLDRWVVFEPDLLGDRSHTLSATALATYHRVCDYYTQAGDRGHPKAYLHAKDMHNALKEKDKATACLETHNRLWSDINEGESFLRHALRLSRPPHTVEILTNAYPLVNVPATSSTTSKEPNQ